VSAPGTLRRWPKGPFPERYRFAAIEARLATAWDEPARRALLATVAAAGVTPFSTWHDPWLHLFEASALETAREQALREEAARASSTLFVWSPPARARREPGPRPRVLGLVPTADPADALGAVGVAGPTHGIGMPAIVRFVVTLRSFADYAIEEMGEDRLVLRLRPRDPSSLPRIAERMTHLCPPLARRASVDEIADALAMSGRLVLDWA
jgi:hypothetical protein